MIKAVFFDYGGTLFDYCPSNYQLLGSVARKYGIDMPDTDPMLSVAFQRQEERMMELFRTRGKPKFSLLKEEDWITLDLILLDAVGVKDPGALGDLVDKFEKREFDFKIYPESIEVIEYLKGRGFGLGIITNLCGPARIVERYEQLREHGILELFDVVTMSGEIEASKPDPEIFLRSLEKLDGIAPEEVLFVGDSYFFDVLGSKKVGMVPVLLDPNLGTDHDCLKIASFKDLIPILGGINGEDYRL